MEWQESKYGQKAMQLFKEGYNCSQAVFLAFEDLFNMEREVMLRLSSSFGGGMGRLREVCGAVSGMFMVAGVLYGYDDPKDYDKKTEHYARIQLLAKEFEALNGSIVCRELLGLAPKKSSLDMGNPEPEKRTEEYYKKRPCAELVAMAASFLEKEL